MRQQIAARYASQLHRYGIGIAQINRRFLEIVFFFRCFMLVLFFLLIFIRLFVLIIFFIKIFRPEKLLSVYDNQGAADAMIFVFIPVFNNEFAFADNCSKRVCKTIGRTARTYCRRPNTAASTAADIPVKRLDNKPIAIINVIALGLFMTSPFDELANCKGPIWTMQCDGHDKFKDYDEAKFMPKCLNTRTIFNEFTTDR